MKFDRQLLNHLKRNENDEALAILERSPDLIKLVDSDGSTLLHHAVKYCNLDMTQCLIDSGVDVNVQDSRGRTALMIAASDPYGIPNLTRILLKAKAYVHLRDVDGGSAFQMIFKNCSQFEDMANLCVRNLIVHYSNDSDKLAKLFLEHKDVLHNLVLAKNPLLTQFLLLKGYPVNIINVHGNTALHEAVRRNDLEHVKILVEYGADVNVKNKRGWTSLNYVDVLFHRGTREMLEVLKILLDRGALNSGSLKPVRELLMYGGREEIQLLLQYNLNFHAKDDRNETALHYLAYNEYENILEELQGMDFDANSRDDAGRTPLHYAVGNSSSVSFLLENGADANALDDQHTTALHLAFSLATGSQVFGFNCPCDIRSVELLLEYGADPQACDVDGRTVIHEAVNNFEFIAVKPVLAHLAMLEARGVAIKLCIQKHIHNNSSLKKSFNFYARKLERMKNIKIWESVRLYDLLMEPEEKLTVYVRYKELVLKLVRVSKKYIPRSNYYYDLIRLGKNPSRRSGET